MGNKPAGEGHANAKLNEKDVRAIREFWKSGEFTLRGLAELFGVSNVTIHRVIQHTAWNGD